MDNIIGEATNPNLKNLGRDKKENIIVERQIIKIDVSKEIADSEKILTGLHIKYGDTPNKELYDSIIQFQQVIDNIKKF